MYVVFFNTSLSVVFYNTSFLKSFWTISAPVPNTRASLTAGLSERVNVSHVSAFPWLAGGGSDLDSRHGTTERRRCRSVVPATAQAPVSFVCASGRTEDVQIAHPANIVAVRTLLSPAQCVLLVLLLLLLSPHVSLPLPSHLSVAPCLCVLYRLLDLPPLWHLLVRHLWLLRTLRKQVLVQPEIRMQV